MATRLGTSLVEFSVEKSSARAAVTRGPEIGKLKNLHCVKLVAKKRLVEINRLRTLVCVYQ
jgi:hypothetical protein